MLPSKNVIGFESWAYCTSEQVGVKKYYGPDMKYIGHEISDEIPF
jgi:hypothetical protein